MRVLLTGAAGLIGGEMTARLVDAGHAVVAIVHANAEIRTNDGRLLDASPYAGKLPGGGQVIVIKGDISLPGLGLTEPLKRQLRENIDLVIHCAAILAFDAEQEQYEAVNIGGTRNIRALLPGARFLHVSTAYVCGAKDGLIPEKPRDASTGFANGYEASKARAETHLLADGRRLVIARPSIVVGTFTRGTIRSFDSVYSMLRLIAEGQISTVPATENATLDFVPIDHVVNGLMDIVANWAAAEGKVFHLCSDEPTSIDQLFSAIGSFDQFDKPQRVYPDQFSADDLPTLQRRIHRRTLSFYESYFQRNPRFVTDNLEKLSGRRCPLVDQQALERMISHCVDRGFLRASR